MFVIRSFEPKDAKHVVNLWKKSGIEEGYHHLPDKLDLYSAADARFFLVGELYRDIVATIVGGYYETRGWIDFLAVAPEFQRHRCGEQMVEKMEELLLAQGCESPRIS